MSEYRGCPSCETLRDMHHKAVQAGAEAIASLKTIKRRNLHSLVPPAVVLGVATILAALVFGQVSKPAAPKPPEPCVESVQIVADGYTHECRNGATMLVTPMQAVDKVLVRCECGGAPGTAGSAK